MLTNITRLLTKKYPQGTQIALERDFRLSENDWIRTGSIGTVSCVDSYGQLVVAFCEATVSLIVGLDSFTIIKGE